MVYDCIVVGSSGGVGSAAAYYAAKRGWIVLGLDRFPPGHQRGSSHGQTRIIRQAYYEHPNYVPLTKETYELWSEIELDTGRALNHRTGLLQIGAADGDVIKGVRRSADEHGLDVQTLSRSDIQRRWPVFNVSENHIGLFEEVAGYLAVEDCVEAMAAGAALHGAKLLNNVGVASWRAKDDRIEVATDTDRFHTNRLILCPGAWASELVEIEIPLRVVRKHQHWFTVDDTRVNRDSGFPAYLIETDQGCFYGFPRISDRGIKVAEHTGGEAVSDPLNVNRELDQVDYDRVKNFMHNHLNLVEPQHSDHSVCMYTMSPDEHFVIDRCPNNPHVAFACGLSGHGFKFTPLIGKYLVSLVDGQSRGDLHFLSLDRFSQTAGHTNSN